MSFKGDIEHLPIVDVIQLMNTSRKSGVLSINGRKGVSQLVFKEGNIVSASHLNNSIRIGEIMLRSGIITEQQLALSLQKQKSDGADRKPLIVTMIQMGLVNEQDAYTSLEELIEITMLEVLTWKKGTFTLEELSRPVDSLFGYYPERLNMEVNVNTQNMLMDALCAFDEKVRDGLITEEADELPEFEINFLSEDDLGLSEMEDIPAQLSKPFAGLTPFDSLKFQMEEIGLLAPYLSATAKESLAQFLATKTINPGEPQPAALQGARVFLFSTDSLLSHTLSTVCTFAGVGLVTAATGREIEELVNKGVSNGCRHFLLCDYQAEGSRASTSDSTAEIRNRIYRQNPDLHMLQLAPATNFRFIIESYRNGVKAVIPRPDTDSDQESFVAELILLLKMLPPFLLNNTA